MSGAGPGPRPGSSTAASDLGAVRLATLIGFTAVLMWATLALLTTFTAGVPPFQLVGMAFLIAFVIGLVWPALQGRPVFGALRQPPVVWLIGVGGLFGFHFFVFTALKLAPPVEASLINYTWPLLIVLFSGLLPGERLRWWHVAGAGMGLGGAALLISNGGSFDLRAEHAAGYAAACASALIWSSYSVVNRRLGNVPTDAVGGFCGATAVLAIACHLAWEETVWPDAVGWLAVLGLGLGPVGLAFFTWDHGVKKGDIQVLGASGYAAPLLSTLLLVAFGQGVLSWPVAVACVAIVGGACLASRDLFRRRPASA
ncbi:MAG: EamA family transporter [Alphaproteobacteria bacterium]|nr:EamA family transporter [Alphaproteobacteria bacterium]